MSRAALVLVLLALLLAVNARAQGELQPAAFLPLVARHALVMTTRTPTATPTATSTPTRTATPAPTNTLRPTATRTATPRPAPTATATRNPALCHPSYPTVCIPPPPPDLDCGDIPYRRFTVLQPDPHGFDRDRDGIGCEVD